MKAVLQRVTKAEVREKGAVISSIGKGYLVFLGIGKDDREGDADVLAEKIAKLRVMADEEGKMNKSLNDVKGDILIVSQFTLYADLKGQNRPSFTGAAAREKALLLYKRFIAKLRPLVPGRVETGKFAAMMNVELENDGPVTIILDSFKLT